MDILQFCEIYLKFGYTLDITRRLLVISIESMPQLDFELLQRIDKIQPIKSIDFEVAFKNFGIKFY